MILKNNINSIGILGGGQLGMFLCKSAKKYNKNIHVYSESNEFSAKKFCDKYFVGDFNDLEKIQNFVDSVEIITVETENIPLKTLRYIEDQNKLKPSSKIIEISQNRVKEKNFINSLNGIKTTDYLEINNFKDLEYAFMSFNNQLIIKSVELGYDGKNQYVINKNNIEQFRDISLKNFIGERYVDFELELSIIVAKDIYGNTEFFPPVKNIHKNGILISSEFPLQIEKKIEKELNQIASEISNKLSLIGIIAIEIFLQKDKNIIINELAPRPHNSGHWSIDCCEVSQFDNLVLSLTDNKILNPNPLYNGIMMNVIGKDYLKKENYKNKYIFHDYWKKEIKKKRKMAHYLVLKEKVKKAF